MEDHTMPFSQRVEKAINNSEFGAVVSYLVKNPSYCKSDPSTIQRLLNNL